MIELPIVVLDALEALLHARESLLDVRGRVTETLSEVEVIALVAGYAFLLQDPGKN